MKGRMLLCAALLSVTGCALNTAMWTSREVRAAEDVPQQFITEDGTLPVDACRSPLVDPRDQTRLRLFRSAPIGGSQHGDYEVPSGRYGVGRNELLRIDCGTGEAIGIVRN